MKPETIKFSKGSFEVDVIQFYVLWQGVSKGYGSVVKCSQEANTMNECCSVMYGIEQICKTLYGNFEFHRYHSK